MITEGCLEQVGDGVFAYLQPDAWGLSNAGLVADGEETLLVDTLFDRAHTQQMLSKMRRVVPAAERIGTVVNTHANGDHCWGNELVRDARIIASEMCAAEMGALTPRRTATLVRAASIVVALGPFAPPLGRVLRALSLKAPADLIEAAPFVHDIFGRFRFDGIELVVPNETFSGQRSVQVGDKTLELIEVGPAHTQGDTLVVDRADKVVFTGDILFVDSHPIVWEGSFYNWMEACRRILDLDVDTVVPGHGPLTDKDGVRRTLEYLRFVYDQAALRHASGVSAEDAAREISMEAYADWSCQERVAVNVRTAYRELSGEVRGPDDVVGLFAAMARHRTHVCNRVQGVSR